MIDIWRCLLIPYDDAYSTLYCNLLLYSFCRWHQRLLFIRYPAGPIIPVEPQNGFYHTKCTEMEHHSLLSILVHKVCKTISGFRWYYVTSWICEKNALRAAFLQQGDVESKKTCQLLSATSMSGYYFIWDYDIFQATDESNMWGNQMCFTNGLDIDSVLCAVCVKYIFSLRLHLISNSVWVLMLYVRYSTVSVTWRQP